MPALGRDLQHPQPFSAPRSPTNPCFVQDLWHLQQADTFPSPVVNRGTKQRHCWPLASAQLCSARVTKNVQGCWARPSLGYHPGCGRVNGVEVKSTIPALPTSHWLASHYPKTQTKRWSQTVRNKMMYFLLIAASYRAGCKGPPLMPPCVCISTAAPPSMRTHVP